MMNATDLPPERILSATIPAQVFGDGDYKENFQRLRSHWHPDKNPHPEAVTVFNKIISLGAVAKVMEEGLRGTEFKTFTYGRESFRYLAKYPFALGVMYCGTGQVLFELADTDLDLAKRYADTVLRRIQPSSRHPELSGQFKPLLPEWEDMTQDGGKLHIRVGLMENLIPLSALLAYRKDRVEPVHAAWICSRMLNCATYCQHLGLVNNAFTLDSFFVDPQSHAGFDIGGWFFSADIGGRLAALPQENLELYPPAALREKRAESRADLFMIKRTVARLLGDPTGTGLKLSAAENPRALVEWVCRPPLKDALAEYRHWEADILTASFGKKKFSVFGINSQVVLANIGA